MMKKRKFPYKSQKKCLRCKENMIFKRPVDRKKKYCSLECRKIPQDTLICGYCEKEFIRKKFGTNRYCSHLCFNKSQTVSHIRICECCGKTFETHDAYDIKRGHARYCSNECKVRKYKIDEEYLSLIDIPEKAYILGYIYSSGILKDINRLELTALDKSDLEYISIFLKSSYPVKVNKNGLCILRIYNHQFVSKLTNLGFLINDRIHTEHPPIDANYNIDFIRGYFDGFNGFIFPNTEEIKKDLNIVVLHFDSMELFEYVHSIIGGDVHRKGIEWIIMITESNSFYNLIYNNSNCFIQRKKDKFLF